MIGAPVDETLVFASITARSYGATRAMARRSTRSESASGADSRLPVSSSTEAISKSKNPVAAISTYLWAVVDEASARGYGFDASKIVMGRRGVRIWVTQGQLEFECKHLTKKLRSRDRATAHVLSTTKLKPHPMMRVVAGEIEPWEKV